MHEEQIYVVSFMVTIHINTHISLNTFFTRIDPRCSVYISPYTLTVIINTGTVWLYTTHIERLMAGEIIKFTKHFMA